MGTRTAIKLIVLFGGLIGAVIAYSFYWNSLAAGLAEGTARWIEARRAEGYAVEHGGLEVRGFPYRLAIEIEQPRLAKPNHPAAWDWRAEALTGYLQPWDLGHVIFVVDGAQQVAWTTDGKRQSARILAEDARASLVLDGAGQPVRYQGILQSGSFELAGVGPAAFAKALVAGRHNRGEDAERPAGSVDFAVHAVELELPAGSGGVLGREVALARLNSFLPVAAPGDPTEAALTAWRQAGGTVEVREMELIWGPLEVRGRGGTALDTALRPTGRLDVEIRGYDATLDALAAAGQMPDDNANTAKFALALLAKNGADGRRFVAAPLVAEDGRLYLGPAEILKLPSLF